MTIAAGTRLGAYEILAPLGAGGMGEVYRARDQKLDRDVAIKVLPPAVATDPDALARFEREAKAVAALSHPNILSIFDFGVQGGISYAVMELLEGETLRAKLEKGPIPQKQSVDFALQVARGLSAAHGKGIVHRDLKPENLFVSRDGHLKILDFGLVKRVDTVPSSRDVSVATVSGHTEPGTILGTAGYMSPEQVKGLPVDHRSDIFSFGTILYELLAGKKAFKRDTNAETMAAIMRDEPPELSGSGRTISPALEGIVRHCLEKDRDHRFQSAGDIAFSLVEQSSPTPTTGLQEVAAPVDEGFRVAVLPFKCTGADADLGAVADGLSEDIVTGLSRFTYLRVITRSSTSRYGNEPTDVRAAGRELGARYVMEGNVRQAGGRLRLAVRLVDAVSGAHLWAESYARPFDPDAVFDLQDDLVARIVSTCADRFGVLARSISDAVRTGEPGQVGPYEALMRGFGYHHRLTAADHADARQALERAVDRAPSNADCWAMLSWVYSHEHAHGFNVLPDSLERALAAARRAVDIAPSNQLAQQALAVVLFFRKETAACLSAAERAIVLNPLDTSNEAFFLIAFTGDWPRGCGLIRRAMELNPHHPRWYGMILAINEYRLANYGAVVDEVLKANSPEVYWSHILLAAAYAQLGEPTAAGSALRNLLAHKGDFARSARPFLANWLDPQLVEHVLDGLRKAGMKTTTRGGDYLPLRIE
jgi:TolB-like protein